MMGWRMVESTMTFHANGEVDLPLKTEEGTLLGTMTFPNTTSGREGFAEWVAFHKVEMKEIISVDTATIAIWLKTR